MVLYNMVLKYRLITLRTKPQTILHGWSVGRFDIYFLFFGVLKNKWNEFYFFASKLRMLSIRILNLIIIVSKSIIILQFLFL